MTSGEPVLFQENWTPVDTGPRVASPLQVAIGMVACSGSCFGTPPSCGPLCSSRAHST